jgi:serine/threonine protein kinase
MGLSFGTSYQIGYYAQTPCYPQLDWIANVDSQLNLKPDNFERAAAIGKGKFGLVFLAQHKPNGKFVAIKYITKQSIYDSQKLQKFQQEINVLQSLDHPFLMHYFGGFEAQACIALVCEYAFGGELYNRMKKRIKFSENEAKFYFCEVACALRYLQETMQLVYRDLKPENILIDFAGHVKICDFGFTAPCTEDENDLRDGCGTAMYIAPEVASGFMKGSHGFPVDWWALGCVLFEMIAGMEITECSFNLLRHLTQFLRRIPN